MSLVAKNLSAWFGNFNVFSNISFSLEQKQCLLLQGSNGSGKTTLLNQISGLSEIQTGSIEYKSVAIKKSQAFREQMIYLTHHLYLKENLSISDNLKYLAFINSRNLTINAKVILEQAELPVLAHQKVYQLSKGQKKRLLLTQLFFPLKLIWLLDEPLTSLDKKSIVWFEKLLFEHCKAGGIAIISSHQKINFPHQLIQLNL